MLSSKVGWKIETMHRFTVEGEEQTDRQDLMIVYSKTDAKKQIKNLVENRAGYNHLPLDYDRSYYENDEKMQVYFKAKGREDELWIEAKLIEFAEVGK